MRIVDASRLVEDEFSAALDLRQALDRAKDPDMTPTTAAELRLLVTSDETEHADHDRIAAFDGGRAVAIGHLERTRDEANAALAIIELDAHDADIPATGPALARLLDLAEADGRTSVIGWGDLTDARDAFWEKLGATRRQVDRDSDLHLDQVDPDLMKQWVDARDERAASVELVSWVGAAPDPHIEAYVETCNAMNDAPRDDFEIEDFVLSAEQGRRLALAYTALGLDLHVMLAVEADGSAVGATSVLLNTHRLDASWQHDTVVLDRHRRRGIGRWLKAAMWFHLREEYPAVTRLRTGNAESNAAMLAINVAMGFTPTHTSAGWQADVSTLRAGLEG